MCNRWLSFPKFIKPRYTLHMKPRDSRGKTAGCNNFSHLPEREAIIMRAKVLNELFVRSEIETWLPFEENPDYWISSWGRVKHLSSYGGKIRYLTPTIRLNKYPYITISLNGKRKGFSISSLTRYYFSFN